MRTSTAHLAEVCEINPNISFVFDDDQLCSFVPMEAVDDEFAQITKFPLKRFSQVAKGYTVFADDDVIVAKITPCMENGKCALLRKLRNGIGFGSTEFHVLRATTQVLPEWLFYFWRFPQTRKHAERNMTGTAGQKRVPSSFLERLEIPIPPVREQERITALLEKADRLRRTRRYSRGLCDTFCQSLFLDMFGDPILNPKGWNIEQLADVIDSERPITYGILKPGPNIPDGVRYVRVVDMQGGAINAIGIRRTTKEIAHEYRRSTLKPADILLSIRGHVGRLAIVPPFLNGANITQDTARLATNGRVCAEYLVECLRFRSLQKRMADLTRGAAVQGINLGDVKLLPIPVPPLSLQEQFADIVRRFERLRAQQREAERQANHLFQTLLHRAFSSAT